MQRHTIFTETGMKGDTVARIGYSAVGCCYKNDIRLSCYFPGDPAEIIRTDNFSSPLGRRKAFTGKPGWFIAGLCKKFSQRSADLSASYNGKRWFHISITMLFGGKFTCLHFLYILFYSGFCIIKQIGVLLYEFWQMPVI